MKIECPRCHVRLPATQLNVAADLAVCAACNEAFSISEIVQGEERPEANFDINQPPRGAWYEDTGVGWRLGATTRSAIAWFLVPFMCVWSGFSLGGIYGSQIVQGEFNLFMSLFGLPFLAGTLLFGSIAVMSVCGRVLVTCERGSGRLFVGVGPLGYSRRIDWDTISGVEESFAGHNQTGSSGYAIALVGQGRIKFGSMLTDERRYYLLQALRYLLAREKSAQRSR